MQIFAESSKIQSEVDFISRRNRRPYKNMNWNRKLVSDEADISQKQMLMIVIITITMS